MSFFRDFALSLTEVSMPGSRPVVLNCRLVFSPGRYDWTIVGRNGMGGFDVRLWQPFVTGCRVPILSLLIPGLKCHEEIET